MSFQSSLSTEIDLLDDFDEEKESKMDLILACVEYISERKERPIFNIRERSDWEKHIRELAVEGPEAFPKMYRMEYSTFMKL